MTIEFVLWLPLFALLLLLAADATLAFMRQSQMWQVSRETARVVSRYGMDEQTAEAFAASAAGMGATTPDVDVTLQDAFVTVDMAMPLRAMAPFGILRFVGGDEISVRVTHAMEPI
ncbi:TadE/TadG family type IV pilus assembly protein [Tropicimonas isoalkanivorans]|uniref:TadE/TadG family type IV pilus assembly protein n=1 Tax=Tropicimonas isoalkanivorans TaxID=441112 RepID=UPI0015A5E762|nr:TadE/TadG family type IV pilus assembly protein [Tropicimonas isoalkanivorans]